jgi:UDP-glucose 4-epimerase
MGMSKALMEKVMTAKARTVDENRIVLCGTRYGNVIASRGSVIPLFVEQIKAGKPLTVTDPKMTRFIMSLENAVELVLYAFENGNAGDIFVQKAPACTIGVLAVAVKELFGAKNEVKIIGTRHGEKLFETLLNREEMASAQDLGDYYRIPVDARDLNYNKYFVEGEERISGKEDYTSNNTRIFPVK